MLSLALHDVDLPGGHIEHLGEPANLRALLVHDRRAEKIGDKMPALRQTHVAAGEVRDLVFQKHRAVHVLHIRKADDEHALVDARRGDGARRAVDIERFERLEKLGAVAPRVELDLAPHAERVDDLSRFEIRLLCHR